MKTEIEYETIFWLSSVCSKCGELERVSSKNYKDGLNFLCKKCKNSKDSVEYYELYKKIEKEVLKFFAIGKFKFSYKNDKLYKIEKLEDKIKTRTGRGKND